MKRRGILRWITGMALVLLLTLALGAWAYAAEPAVVASGTCGETWSDVNWTLDDAGTLTISGEGVMRDFNSGSDTPWAQYKQTIRSASIEDGVTSIGGYAFFDCPALTGVTMGKDVESIGTMAFYSCGGLTDVTMGDGLTTIGQYAFGFCAGLTNVILPDHVTDIGDAAFTTCTGLTGVTIPDSVTKIGAWAFYSCSGLTDVYYNGTAADWATIAIDESNDPLLNAALHCRPTVPAVKPSYVGASGKPYAYWSAVDGADWYEVYRATSKSGPYTFLIAVEKLNYTDTSAQSGTTYFYKVKAVNDAEIASDYSDPVTITCRCARPVGKSDYWASTGKPYIKWDAVDGAGKYYVYRSTSKDGSYQYIGSATKTNYTDSTAVAGTTYYYKVKAISSVQSAANSSLSTAVTITCRCARPVGKSDYWAATGKPYIKWDAVDGAGKYYVYRSTSKDGSYQYIGSATKTNYTDSTAVAGTTYYYKVKAISADNTAANSGYSTAVTITCRCARPVGKSDYWASTGKPYIKWDAVDGAGKYYVYRSTSKDGSYQYIGSATKTNYTDSTAVAGTTYYYKVKAVSSVQSAANSSLSTAVTITCRCARPVGKSDYWASTGKPYIKWDAVDGAGKYYVYRSTSKDGSYQYIGSATKTNYTDSTAVAGTTYYYKVKAVSSVQSAANSAYSTAVTITCRCARPVVKITTVSGKPKLTWGAVAGAEKYYIYRATSKNGTYEYLYTTKNLFYTNKSAVAGTTYYKVKAVSSVKSAANSAFSTVVSIKAK